MKALALFAILAVAATPENTGKKIYTGKCARCHKLYDASKYDERTWDSWMQKMKSKAKLSDDQYRQLLEYIATTRSQK